MPKKQPEPKPRPVGRPRSIPDGARPRAVRMTDAEYAAVLAYLAKLRGAPLTARPRP